MMDQTVAFIQRNARPLDFLLFEHSRGRAESRQVLTALAAYQNPDGGFAWAIEPDNFTEDSTPMGTWSATTALREIGCFDRSEAIVDRAVNYLLSSRRPDGFWDATAPSTVKFPHAEWWEDHGPEHRVWGINPTAPILGYLLRTGIDVDRDVDDLVAGYVDGDPVSMHGLLCALTLHDDMSEAGQSVSAAFTKRLRHDIDAMLERDPLRWSGYVARPSTLFTVGRAEFAEPYAELITQEQQHLRHTMNEDGSWDIPWQWKDYPKEWPVAQNWWKAIRARHLLKFLAM